MITLADSTGAKDEGDRRRFLGDIIMLAGGYRTCVLFWLIPKGLSFWGFTRW